MPFSAQNQEKYWGKDWRNLNEGPLVDASPADIATIVGHTEAAFYPITTEEDGRTTWDNSGFETFAKEVVVERDRTDPDHELVETKTAISWPDPEPTDNSRWFVKVIGPWGIYRYPMLSDLEENPEDSGIQLLKDQSDPNSWSEPRPMFTDEELGSFYEGSLG
jgi:hypothetical protein